MFSMGVGTVAILFILGLAVGSFLNVVAFRYDPERSLFRTPAGRGRSHCAACHAQLRWYELIPLVSFLVQIGRCRSCKARLSFQYPIVELLSGVFFVVVPLVVYTHYGVRFMEVGGASAWWYYALSALWIAVFIIFLLIAAIDMRLTIIPDEANVLLAFLGAGIMAVEYVGASLSKPNSFIGFYAELFGMQGSVWVNVLMGVVVGAGIFGLLVFLTRGRGMGLGDVKLGAAGGVLLGWPDIALAVALAFVLGALVNLPALFRGTRSMKDAVPFGPFIVLGMFLTFFFGTTILAGYFALFPV